MSGTTPPLGRAGRLSRELFTASRFAIVGVAATLVHMAVVWPLVALRDVPALQANFIAYLCAFSVSFAGHYFWTFEAASPMRRAFVRFVAISLTGFLVNSSVLALLLRSELLTPATSTLAAATIVPVLSFVASRLWGFKPR